MDKKALANQIYNISHITGTFKLRSGQISNEYFDKYLFEARPELLTDIADKMAKLIPPGTEIIAGLEMGGIPVAAITKMPEAASQQMLGGHSRDGGGIRHHIGLARHFLAPVLDDDARHPANQTFLPRRHVHIARNDAVGFQRKRQLHVIIDDKGNAEAPAELLQLPSLIQAELTPLILGAILKNGNAATQRPPYPADQVIPLVGNQVDAGDRQLLGSRIIYHESE